MKIGTLLYPRENQDEDGQLHLPFWGASIALIVGMDYCIDCDYEEPASMEERRRWIVLEQGELLFMTPFLVNRLYEYR